jgi:hypothetical protein
MDLSKTANPLEVTYTAGAAFTMLLFLVLLIFAIRDANRVASLPADHPDRMIAADGIINESIRLILLAGGMLIIGTAALVTPPPSEATDTVPSVLGVALFVVLITWQVGLAAWALKDLWFRRQLFKRMSSVRLVCADSTFAGCQFGKTTAQGSGSVVGPPPIPPDGGH